MTCNILSFNKKKQIISLSFIVLIYIQSVSSKDA